METNIYVILPPKYNEFPQHSVVKIFLVNDSYFTISLWNTSNLGEFKSKSAYFFRESVAFPSVQLEFKKGHFELTNEEWLVIIKYMELSIQTLFWQTILLAYVHVLDLVLFSLIFVFFLSYQLIPASTISVPVSYHLSIMV